MSVIIPDEILHAARMIEAEFNTLVLTSRNSANDHWHRQAQGMQATAYSVRSCLAPAIHRA